MLLIRVAEDEFEFPSRRVSAQSVPPILNTGRPPLIVSTPGGAVFVPASQHVCSCPPRSIECGC